MNKKLMAAAVAGALALPGVALAQSSVTISGIVKVGVDNLKIGNPGAARSHSSETRVTDNSSRILFNVTEDLGGGLSAIAQMDLRFSADVDQTLPNGYGAVSSTTRMSGNTFVGLRSKTLGTISLGRLDLHYGSQPDDIASKAGALMASSVSLMDSTIAGAIAGNTRTPNVVAYDTPNWNGFTARVAYSTNPAGVESDLANVPVTVPATTALRKGRAWNFAPKYTAKNWGVGYTYWSSKADNFTTVGAAGAINNLGVAGAAAGTATGADQKGQTYSGWYQMGGLKAGLAWNKSETRVAITGVKSSDRTAWTIPVSYAMGKHNIYAHYTKAGNDKTTVANDSAKMIALAYVYDLSKRTSVGLTYAKITNDVAGNYNFFTNGANGAFGSQGSAPAAGEDPRLIAATVRHAF